MMKYVDTMVEQASKQRSPLFKILSTLVGMLVFLVLLPLALYYGAVEIQTRWLINLWRSIELGLAIISLAIGAIILIWSVLLHVLKGKGTPVPVAPPQNLIISGPYKYCRNPIQLGVMLYYFAIGTYCASIGIGVAMLLLALIIGALYHKLAEEKELKARFGKEYEDYKAVTPFLLPKIWS